ncbi:hypothetical protein [Qipengyuania nanhaisediminis]|uniref:hypothetical protein n=1 Tax=Qipengyuania nanhaisediminis TaxID=604088 RepID=UPI0038B38F51
MVQPHNNRSKLLVTTGTAALAIALAASPDRAQAQAFQATETVTTGAATRIFTGTGTETIRVDTTTATITWTPDEDGAGNALDFLPTFNVATFENGANNADFAVLNIINPATNGNVTVFDGTVISQLNDLVTGATGPGGTVAFYSPSGILIGSNAVFDVGNLVLTTLEPDETSFFNFATAGGQANFTTPNPPGASIIIQPGAQITASAENSYFALVSAEIQMFGTSDVNGSTVFAAGEEVNLTVSNGLFDIQIPVGTSSPTPITIDGDVGGPSSTGAGDNHLIYAVAAAQSDPISLLFSGNLGFDPAAGAGIVNGEIILSANFTVSDRNAAGNPITSGINATFVEELELTPIAGTIRIEDASVTSDLLAVANDRVEAVSNTGPSSFDGNLLLYGASSAEIIALNGQLFTVAGDVLVTSAHFAPRRAGLLPGEADAQGGVARIVAQAGGTINIAGEVLVDATAHAGFDFNDGFSGDAQGGIATIETNGGTITIGGPTEVRANAMDFGQGIITGGNLTGGEAQVFSNGGGSITFADVVLSSSAFSFGSELGVASTGANATGGNAFFSLGGGGQITVNGDADFFANGGGGAANNAVSAGTGTGGLADIAYDGNGDVVITGNLNIQAIGSGGVNVGGRGGDGFGGVAAAIVDNNGSLTIGGLYQAQAQGFGGAGIGGGDGFGGSAGIAAVTGTVDITSVIDARAQGIGGDASEGFGGDGGDGFGGFSYVQAVGTLTDSASVTVGGQVTLISEGTGGAGGNGDGAAVLAGRGGNGFGGENGTVNQAEARFGAQFVNGAYALAGGDNGTLTITGPTSLRAEGFGGVGGAGGLNQDGGDGGDGTGGTAEAGARLIGTDGSVGAGSANFGTLNLRAFGIGGAGGIGSGTGSLRGNGGNGSGLGAFIFAEAGSLDASFISLVVNGTGGEGHIGGDGSGGTAELSGGYDGTLTVPTISALATGRGGNGDNGGGSAVGGDARIVFAPVADPAAAGLTIDAANITLDVSATGGDAAAGIGGGALGGNASIVLTDDTSSLTTTNNVTFVADANAGLSNGSGAASDATAGMVDVRLDGQGTITIGGLLSITANSFGGANDGPGTGGNAFGGFAEIFVSNGGTLEAGSIDMSLSSFGGYGIDGGSAIGGEAFLATESATIDVAGSVNAVATAEGGNALDGLAGDAQGGRVILDSIGTGAGPTVFNIGADLLADASASGGVGEDFSQGGEARGGEATASVEESASLTIGGSATFHATARGGSGIGGGDAIGGLAGARVITGLIDIGGNASADASATGGDSGVDGQVGGDGGDAFGGIAAFFANGTQTGTGTFRIGGDATVLSEAFGGVGGQSDGGAILGGRGGDAFGGSEFDSNPIDPTLPNGAYLVAGGDNGALTVIGTSTVSADASGGEGGSGTNGVAPGDGGNGTGGTAQVGLDLLGTDGSVGLGTASFGDVVVSASGFGGFGGFDSPVRGDGGDGQGGRATFSVRTGTADAGEVTVRADGAGGDGGNGGTGTGGPRAGIFTASGGSFTIASFNAFAQGLGGISDSGIGGSGFGGEAFIGFQDGNGTITGDAMVDASGFGGESSGNNGGDGTGGTADIAIFTPTIGTGIVGGNASVVANGTGGEAGAGFTGGTGTGGNAFVQVQAGGTITLGSAVVTASGLGGTGDDAGGGNGIGGFATLEAIDSGSVLTIQTNSVVPFLDDYNRGGLLAANGVGGNATGGSGIGGAGTGGQAIINVTSGANMTLPLDPANDPNAFANVRILARGIGGGTSVDGAGGVGTGGLGLIFVDSADFEIGAATLSVFGAGGSSLDGDATVDGGDGNGGTRQITIDNGANVTAEFAGGISGGIGGNGSGGGDGGDAIGGSGLYSVRGGSTLNLVGANIFADNSAGGNGAIGGGASGGDVRFEVDNSTVNLTANANGDASALFGGEVTGGQGQSEGGDAIAGDVDLELTSSTWDGGPVTIAGNATGGAANGVNGIGGDAVSGNANMLVSSSDVIVSGSACGIDPSCVVRSLDITSNAIGGEAANGTGGNAVAFEAILTGTNADITAIGEVTVSADARGGSGLIGGNASAGEAVLDLFGGSMIAALEPSVLSDISISADADGGFGDNTMGDAEAGASFLLMSDAALFASILEITAIANESIPTATSGGEARGGDAEAIIEGASTLTLDELTLESSAFAQPDGTAIAGNSGLFVGNVGGSELVDADLIVLDASASGGATNEVGRLTIDIDNNASVDTVDLTATALGDTLPASALGHSILVNGAQLRVTGDMTVDVLGNLDITAEAGGTIGDPAGNIFITVLGTDAGGGLLSIFGDDDNHIGLGADAMMLSSHDIEITDGARVAAGDLTLQSLDEERPMFLGDGGGTVSFSGATGYVLSNDEGGRIDAGTVTIIQPVIDKDDDYEPDIVIGNITAFGSLDDGVSAINIQVSGGGGVVRVEGVLDYRDLDVTDTLSIFAERQIEVVTPGGIFLRDPAGNPGGRLLLTSNNVWVADSVVIGLLQDDVGYAGRNDDLMTALAGSDDPLGYVRAGGVTVEFGDSFLVRNTGTDTEQGGILVSDGGLTIFSPDAGGGGGNPVDVFAYGARIDDQGNLITGEAFFNEVNFNNDGGTGSTEYTDESEFNDCVINTGQCPVGTPDPDPDPDPDQSDGEPVPVNNPAVIEEPIAVAGPIPPSPAQKDEEFGFDFQRLVSEPEDEDEEEIDDPVSSGGDASLYSRIGGGADSGTGNDAGGN